MHTPFDRAGETQTLPTLEGRGYSRGQIPPQMELRLLARDAQKTGRTCDDFGEARALFRLSQPASTAPHQRTAQRLAGHKKRPAGRAGLLVDGCGDRI